MGESIGARPAFALVPYHSNLMIFAQDFFDDFWKPVPLGFKRIDKSPNFLVPGYAGLGVRHLTRYCARENRYGK